MKDQHVIPHGSRWEVKGEGNRRATHIADTQKQALTIARRIARNQGSDVVIHLQDGSVLEDFYGNDPFPPGNGRG